MLVDIAIIIAFACIVIGLSGCLWNLVVALKAGRRKSGAEVSPVAPSVDRQLYERAVTLVRENRFADGAKILEGLGLAREASSILERGGLVHEAAAVFLRRNRYHRAGEVYARHKMWEQAGQSYLLQAELPRD